jgi:hypothetical protein
MPPTLTTSDALTLTAFRAMVFGPPGVGKTFSSLTISEKLPATFSHIKKAAAAPPPAATILDDLLWIGLDEGATDGFRQAGFSVPLIDLSKMAPKEMDLEITAAQKIVEAQAASGKTKTLVIDTVSKLDEMLFYKHYTLGGLRKFELYDAMRVGHKNFVMPFKALKVNILYLCHAKSLMEGVDANQQRARTASGAANIVPAITGSSLNHYRGDASFIFSVGRKKLPGTEGFAHLFYTSHRDFEGKSRLALPEEMPADWREVRKVAAQKVTA